MRRLYPLSNKAAGIAGVLIGWEIAARLLGNPAFSPASLSLAAAVRLLVAGTFWPHMAASLQIISLGFVIAATVGFTLGILAAEFRAARALIMPSVDAVRGVAALAVFPALIVLLGLGTWSKTFVIFWTSWPAVLLSTLYGLRAVDQEIIEAGIMDGAGRAAVLHYIRLPLASGAILTGLRIGMSGGWIGLVAAEMLGSHRGLGFFVLSNSQTFRFPEMYGTILIIAGLGFLMNTGLLKLQEATQRRLFDAPCPDRRLLARPAGSDPEWIVRSASGGEVRKLQSL